MTAQKSERLLNLLITLLVARHYVTKERIRHAIEGYREQGDDAFEKMFERDKEELRSLGVPIEVGAVDKAFDDEPGYRIRRGDFELPHLDLAADEAAVVGLAARVWEHAGIASAASDALRKLGAAGIEVDREALDVVAAHDHRVRAGLRAVVASHRAPYRGLVRVPATRGRRSRPAPPAALGRRVVLRTLVRRRPRRRPSRAAPVPALAHLLGRAHRRQVGVVHRPRGHGPPCADARPRAAAGAAHHGATPRASGAGHALRRRGGSVAGDTAPGPGGVAWDEVLVEYAETAEMASEVLQHGPDVVVVAPEDLRDVVVTRLRAVTGEGP